MRGKETEQTEHRVIRHLPTRSGYALLCDLSNQTQSDVAASELADLRQQVAELHEAVRARDDFIAIAAHELRNPMTPIMVVAELALKGAHDAQGTCPPRMTALLERILFLVQNFIQRSTRLLDVSRIEAGNLQLEPSLFDLSALVLSVAQQYESLFGWIEHETLVQSCKCPSF